MLTEVTENTEFLTVCSWGNKNCEYHLITPGNCSNAKTINHNTTIWHEMIHILVLFSTISQISNLPSAIPKDLFSLEKPAEFCVIRKQ